MSYHRMRRGRTLNKDLFVAVYYLNLNKIVDLHQLDHFLHLFKVRIFLVAHLKIL